MSHNRTHHQRLARLLSRAVGDLGYQQALGHVRDAAEAGALPSVLDDAGMNDAVRILTGRLAQIPTQVAEPGSAITSDVRSDISDGRPRHMRPGPDVDVNAALLKAGIALPSTVDYRPDGLYRVWRHGAVVMTVREWPRDSARWSVSTHDGNGDGVAISACSVSEAVTAMIAAANGTLTAQALRRMDPWQRHQCSDECTIYRYVSRAWCITHAQHLIGIDPTAAEFTEQGIITSLDDTLGITPLPPNMGRIQWIPVDTEAAKTADLSVPLISIRLRDDSEDSESDVSDGARIGDFIIDSWERAYRARTEGLTWLPIYTLSAAAERAVRRPV